MATDLSNWSKLSEKDVFQKKERHRFGDPADKKYQKIHINFVPFPRNGTIRQMKFIGDLPDLTCYVLFQTGTVSDDVHPSAACDPPR